MTQQIMSVLSQTKTWQHREYDRAMDAYKSLWAAVLVQAIRDYHAADRMYSNPTVNRKNAVLKSSVRNWMTRPKKDTVNGFVNVCEMLCIDAAKVRQEILGGRFKRLAREGR